MGRAVRRRVLTPDNNELGVLDIGEHVDEHATHSYVRGDHGKGYVAECTYAKCVRRAEGKQDAGC